MVNGVPGPTDAGRLINEFRSARKHPRLVVLEGLHPIKHGLRFGAEFVRVVTSDKESLRELARQLAPDVADRMLTLADEVHSQLFADLAPRPPETGVIALARRPETDAHTLLQHERQAPLVLLERPSHLGNIGAVIRLAAGAGASGVVTSGIHDPWGPDAVRGGAGLQYALPVARISDDSLTGGAASKRAIGSAPWRGPLLALDPEGDPLTAAGVPANSIIAFGSERFGLSDELLARADGRIAIPMQPGVSSLNLATSVAIVLYGWRLSPSTPKPDQAK